MEKEYNLTVQACEYIASENKRQFIDTVIEEAFSKDFGQDYRDIYHIDFITKPKIIINSLKETTFIGFKVKITEL